MHLICLPLLALPHPPPALNLLSPLLLFSPPISQTPCWVWMPPSSSGQALIPLSFSVSKSANKSVIQSFKIQTSGRTYQEVIQPSDQPFSKHVIRKLFQMSTFSQLINTQKWHFFKNTDICLNLHRLGLILTCRCQIRLEIFYIVIFCLQIPDLSYYKDMFRHCDGYCCVVVLFDSIPHASAAGNAKALGSNQ